MKPTTWKSRLCDAVTLPHNLGVDAALVAATWQAIISHSLGCSAGPELTASLFFAVWAIYLGDRIWDAWRGDPAAPRMERHRFARQHRLVFGLLPAGSLLLATAFAVSAIPEVPPATWAKLALVAALCAGYYFVRARFPEWERGRPVVVGGVFAAGTLLAVPGLTGVLFCWLVLALGSLFTANVRICVWSEARSDGRNPPITLFRPLVLSALGFTVAAIGGHWEMALAGLASLASLGLLYRKRKEIEDETLAMGADTVLFVPPLIVLVLAFWLGS